MTRILTISHAPRANSERWRPEAMTWPDLLCWLDLPNPAATKECGGWVGGRFRDDRRDRAHVDRMSVLQLDADYARAVFRKDVADELHGLAHAGHTTWRSGENGLRYRVLVPLSRDVTDDEYRRLARAVMTAVDLEYWDPKTFQSERFMWRPSAHPDRTGSYEWWASCGELLPVDAWLARAAPEPTPLPRPRLIDLSTDPSPAEVDKGRAILAKSIREVETLTAEVDDFTVKQLGGRSDAAIHVLPTLLRFVLGGVLSAHEVVEEVWAATQRADGPHPFPRPEYDSVVASAWRYAEGDGADRPRVADPITDLAEGWAAFFDQTAILRHIRDSAHAGEGPAPVLFGYTVARIALECPINVVLPGKQDGSVGSRQGLNLGILVSADTGGGKSSGRRESRDLVAVDQSSVETVAKTGPGMQEVYYTGTGQNRRLKADPRMLFCVDEINTLRTDAKDKTGGLSPELVGTLCSMLMGELVGAALATPGASRLLPDGAYRAVMVAGAQTANVGPLLYDTASGTPQRFLWVPGVDPSLPDELVPDPGPLPWNPAIVDLLNGMGQVVIPVPQHILDEIRAARRRRTRGEAGPDEMDASHRYLMRLKVAALLGVMHGEVAVTDQWWHLAGMAVDLSLAEQARCDTALRDARKIGRDLQAKEDAVVRAQVDDHVAADQARKRRVRDRVKEKLAEADGRRMGLADLRRTMKHGADRDTFDYLLPLMETEGVVDVVVVGEDKRGRDMKEVVLVLA